MTAAPVAFIWMLENALIAELGGRTGQGEVTAFDALTGQVYLAGAADFDRMPGKNVATAIEAVLAKVHMTLGADFSDGGGHARFSLFVLPILWKSQRMQSSWVWGLTSQNHSLVWNAIYSINQSRVHSFARRFSAGAKPPSERDNAW
jgi:hypothetical protein